MADILDLAKRGGNDILNGLHTVAKNLGRMLSRNFHMSKRNSSLGHHTEETSFSDSL